MSPLLIRALTMPRQSLPKRSARQGQKLKLRLTFSHVPRGERDPVVLKMAALSASVECTHYSHDISPDAGQPEHLAHGKGKSRPGVTPDSFSCDCRLRPAPVPPRYDRLLRGMVNT